MHALATRIDLADYTAAIEEAGRDELTKSGICPDLADHVDWAAYAHTIAVANGYTPS